MWRGKGPRSKDANLRGLRRSQLGGASGHTAINHTVSDSSWDQAQVTAPGRWAWTSEEAQCKALTQPGPLTALS